MVLIKTEIILDIPDLKKIQKDYSDLWYYINQSVQECYPEYGIKMLAMEYKVINKDEFKKIVGLRSRSQMTSEFVFKGRKFPKDF